MTSPAASPKLSRLFVAITIDAAASAAIDAVARELSRRTDATTPRPRITWVRPPNAHLTVRFIGEVDAARAAAIGAALAPPLAVPAFDVTLNGIGAFPPRGAPRVIWVGVSEGADRVIAVESEVSARLEAAGVPAETREFRPHLTIGRVRDAGGLRSAAVIRPAAAPIARVRVEHVTLFHSRLSSNGSDYTPILESALA